jgi:hypothetical protein
MRKLQNNLGSEKMDTFDDLYEKRKGLVRWIKPEDLDTALEYNKSPDCFIRTIDVMINGKLRHLITYMPNEKGYALRKLHEHYSEYLQRHYRPSSASYAYRKKKNIVMCANQHLSSTVFFKTDIHAYFDSISEDRMLKRIYRLHLVKLDRSVLAEITKACFYQGRLPIGFVTSPVLSDIFLVTLDRKYAKNKNVVYTRYADDFIVSTSGENSHKKLIAFRLQMEQDLGYLDLELNRKKTYIRTLAVPGDAIHVLGLNIVKTETNTNRITISDRYVRKTCKAICAWLTGADPGADPDATFAKVYGQISFIRQCSANSYSKLQHMTKVKCGYTGEWTSDALKSALGTRA